MIYSEYTTEEAKHMLENHRFEDGQGLRSLKCWKNADFRDSVFGFIKAMGYHNTEAARKKDREYAEYERNKGKSQEKIELDRLIATEIPSRYYNTNEYKTDYWPAGLKIFGDFMRKWHAGDKVNLYVHGSSYSGKSHLVAYSLIEFAKKGLPCYWVNVPDFLNMCNDDTFKKEIHNIRIKMHTAKILVLDDIFKRSFFKTGSSTVTGAASILYSIIEKRLGVHSTIYIDEKDVRKDEVKNSVSSAVVNRIADNAIFLEGKKKYYAC